MPSFPPGLRSYLSISRLLALLVFLAALAGCQSSTDEEPCTSHAQCPSTLQCVGGECVVLVPPPSRDAGDEGGDAAASGCVEDAECGLNATCDQTAGTCSCGEGYHRCGAACVADDDPAACGAGCEVCPEVAGGSAICREGACGIACANGLEPVDGACTGCTSSASCSDPAASACREGRCAPCAGAQDCAHLEGQGVCSSGVCVPCTVGDDSACGGRSCDPATNTCTETLKESRPMCASCRADSECEPDHHCVPMQFQGEDLERAYCLKLSALDGCAPPYPETVSRTSVSGVTDIFCAPKESLTTCEAVRDYNASCVDSSDCGVEGVDDARCERIDFENLVACTFPCDAQAQCPTTSVAGCSQGEVGVRWCGAY